MDLLTGATAALAPRGGTIRLALGVSAVAHAVMAGVVVLLPVRGLSRDVPVEIMVDVLTDLVTPPEALPAPVPAFSPSAPPRPRPEARARERIRPSRPALSAPPEALPAPPVAPPSETAVPPDAPATGHLSADAPSNVPVPAGVAAGAGSPAAPAGSTLSRSGGTQGTGSGSPGGETQRRIMTDRYRAQVLRTRIREVFRYPSEARDLELAGRVLLSVSIGRDGRLLDVRLSGRCPHPILCSDGLRTIRAAAPFPPIPVDMGPSIVLEVPLTYAFDVALD